MPPDNLPVKFEVGATAEIKTEVPSQASGRLVNALSDALSPFTEGLGFVGDQIRAARKDRAITRLLVAQQRMIAAGLVVKPVPDEFLLSWTERTAQDGENDLEAIWQNLLISASHAYERRMKSFPAILAELNGEDAHFLESVCPRSQAYDERQVTFAINGNLQAVHRAFGSGSGIDIDFAGVKLALDTSDLPFARAQSVEVGFSGESRYTPSESYQRIPTTFGILIRNGLLETSSIEIRQGGVRGNVKYVRVTPLGEQFVKACRGPIDIVQ